MLSPEDSTGSQLQRTQPEIPLDDSHAAPIFRPPLSSPESLDASDSLHWLSWVFFGDQGLRAGWSVIIFSCLFILLGNFVGAAFFKLHLLNGKEGFTAISATLSKLIEFLATVGAAALLAWIERRRSLFDYNLAGPRRAPHFLSGLAAGFLALSALVGALALGGWLHFGSVHLSGTALFKYAGLWAAAFLLVGCVEEGLFRCYLQSTLTRGINYWWALGIVTIIAAFTFFAPQSYGAAGVYAAALLGLLPCMILHLKKTARSAFWQAAWVTSTFFGYWHTSNPGESWIGILAAALIGFVFCVSIYVTGSAWWAIGCHAAWDWAETFFYGTADSGLVASGHYMTTSPVGNQFWSGGADGPEGSILVLGIVLLLLAALLVIHGRKKPGAAALERAIG